MNDTSGPAFPIQAVVDGHGAVHEAMQPGMSMRDWFAGQAIAGMLSNGFMPFNYASGSYSIHNPYPFGDAAYKIADVMLAARAATPATP